MMTMYELMILLIAGSMASSVLKGEVFEREEFIKDENENGAVNPRGQLIWTNGRKHDTTSGNVAFSATLTEQVTKAGNSQHLKYNKVWLNDGDAYSSLTGIFRAPKCGVYSFSFSVAADFNNFVKANLVVQTGANTASAVDGAVATANHCSYCFKGRHAQGTNTAIVHLHKGQQAWIELDAESSTYDDPNNSYNSFSGFLLYTRE